MIYFHPWGPLGTRLPEKAEAATGGVAGRADPHQGQTMTSMVPGSAQGETSLFICLLNAILSSYCP